MRVSAAHPEPTEVGVTLHPAVPAVPAVPAIPAGTGVPPVDARGWWRQHPVVADAGLALALLAVTAAVDTYGPDGRRPGALVFDVLLAAAGRLLARFKLPGAVQIVDTLPRSVTGKIMKWQLDGASG